MPDRVFFIVCYGTVMNFGYATLQIWLLQYRPKWPRWLGAGALVWAGLMSGLLKLQLCGPAAWEPFVRG